MIDATDPRALAEFYAELLGLRYRDGDEPPADGGPDAHGPDEHGADWLVLVDESGTPVLAFQRVPELPRPTWPEEGVAQQLHLDTTVATVEELDAQHDRALRIGASLLFDRSDDEDEPLRVYADPAGHPFCIFVG